MRDTFRLIKSHHGLRFVFLMVVVLGALAGVDLQHPDRRVDRGAGRGRERRRVPGRPARRRHDHRLARRRHGRRALGQALDDGDRLPADGRADAAWQRLVQLRHLHADRVPGRRGARAGDGLHGHDAARMGAPRRRAPWSSRRATRCSAPRSSGSARSPARVSRCCRPLARTPYAVALFLFGPGRHRRYAGSRLDAVRASSKRATPS